MDEHRVRTRMRAEPENVPGADWRVGLRELLGDLTGSELVMAEIGCYAGESTEVFAASGRFRKIYAVDPWLVVGSDAWRDDWEGGATAERVFDEMAARHPGLIRKLRQPSTQAALRVHPGTLDFIYIDGDHSYEGVRADLLMFMPAMRRGAVMAGHDYCDVHPGVARAFHEVFGRGPDKRYSDHSWMVRL